MQRVPQSQRKDGAARTPNRSAHEREPDTGPGTRTAIEAPHHLTPAAISGLQATAGNRAVQRAVAPDTVQRRWNPPSLNQWLMTAAATVAAAPEEYTRYEFKAQNPLQEGFGTFIDVQGPLPGAME